MANKPQKKAERFVSPEGVAVFPRLTTPDTKFKKEGERSVKLRLPPNEAAPIIKRIEEATSKAYQKECIVREVDELSRSEYLPYSNEMDDQGKPTGNVLFKFTQKASFKDKKTEQVVQLPLRVVDKYGKDVTEEVWGGSRVKVCYYMKPYYTEKVGFGMSLKMAAVQVMELVTKGAAPASAYGFTVESEPTSEVSEGDDEGTEVAAKGATNGKAKKDF